MGFLKRKKQLPRQLALGQLEDAMGQVQAQEAVAVVQAPLPFADQCSRVRTGSGKVAHREHPDLGIMCEAMNGWPGPWFQAPDPMPDCSRCMAAARVEDERDVA